MQMIHQHAKLESGADMQISNGIGRENTIDKLVFLTGNPREMYEDRKRYDLEVDYKIAKLQAGLV